MKGLSVPGATPPNIAYGLLADTEIEGDRCNDSRPCSSRKFAVWPDLEDINHFVVGENRLWLGSMHESNCGLKVGFRRSFNNHDYV